MTGYTYEYDYAGWTSTGIQGVGSKISGGAIKGRFVIEPFDDKTFNVAVRGLIRFLDLKYLN